MRTSGGRLTGRTEDTSAFLKKAMSLHRTLYFAVGCFHMLLFLWYVVLSATNTSYSIINIIGHEIKRRLLLGRKVMTNLDSIFKRRDITLPTKSV